jgi:hypothetical protein
MTRKTMTNAPVQPPAQRRRKQPFGGWVVTLMPTFTQTTESKWRRKEMPLTSLPVLRRRQFRHQRRKFSERPKRH